MTGETAAASGTPIWRKSAEGPGRGEGGPGHGGRCGKAARAPDGARGARRGNGGGEGRGGPPRRDEPEEALSLSPADEPAERGPEHQRRDRVELLRDHDQDG